MTGEESWSELVAALTDWAEERREGGGAPEETVYAASEVMEFTQKHRDLWSLVDALEAWGALLTWSESSKASFAAMQVDKIVERTVPKTAMRVREERLRTTLDID